MQLKIEKLVYGGDGLARVPEAEAASGKSVFVPFVLEGERVKAKPIEEKRSFMRARLESLIETSPDRVAPGCPYYQRCGGCHYQHAAYPRQLAIKAAVIRETIARTGKQELPGELHIHPSPEWHYRNRTRLQVRSLPGFGVGYFRFRSHELIAVEECPISSPLINQAIRLLWASGGRGIADQPEEIEFFVDDQDQRLLAAAYCRGGTRRTIARELAQDLRQLLPSGTSVVVFAEDGQRSPASEPKLLASAGSAQLLYQTRQHRYQVSAASFFQVNRFVIDELVRIVTSNFSGSLALDLYAGVGLFSAILGRSFQQVIAVEASPTASRDLAVNVPEAVTVIRSTAEEYLAGFSAEPPDLVVVDPPRGGLERSVVRDLIRLGTPRIAYVSCDPATLARDLARFAESGYGVEEAHLIDLFPQTYHVESVFHLSRRDGVIRQISQACGSGSSGACSDSTSLSADSCSGERSYSASNCRARVRSSSRTSIDRAPTGSTSGGFSPTTLQSIPADSSKLRTTIASASCSVSKTRTSFSSGFGAGAFSAMGTRSPS